MTVRMREVASRAGVSTKTVSNVITGRVHVAPETRQRVQQAIDDMGYLPNLAARSLRSGRTGIIAVALPRLDEPSSAELAAALIDCAASRNWAVVLSQTAGRAGQDKLALARVRPNLIDGLIIVSDAHSVDAPGSPHLMTPLVVLGAEARGSRFDRVAMDDMDAGRLAARHLMAVGSRRLAAIGCTRVESAHPARLRLTGFLSASCAADVSVPANHVQEARNFRQAEGAQAMDRLLDLPKPPDAVYCVDDQLALGAMHALQQRGVRVPDDVAVIGTADAVEGRYGTPTLSTISQDAVKTADLALDMLLERIGGGSGPPRHVLGGTTLKARQSTARTPARPATDSP